MCSSCGLNIVPISRASNYVYTIPIQEFTNKSSRCKFQVAYCTSSEKVNTALKPYGIQVNSMDGMKKLADDYDSGELMRTYKTDIWQVISRIEFTPEEKAKTECNIACTY